MGGILWDAIDECQRYPIMGFRKTRCMTIGDRIKQARAARGMSRPELAEAARIKYPTLAGIENNDQAGTTQLPQLAAALRVNIRWLQSGKGPRDIGVEEDPAGDWADIRAFEQHVGAGAGTEAQEYAETHALKFKTSSLRKQGLLGRKLAVFYAKGDSMLPRIHTGDAILFDEQDTTPVDGGVFVVAWRGEVYVKRIEIVDDIVLVKSDNPNGDHQWRKAKRLDSPRDPIEILGRVRWIGSWEG